MIWSFSLFEESGCGLSKRMMVCVFVVIILFREGELLKMY